MDKSEVLLPLSRNVAFILTWTYSLFNDGPSHLLTDGKIYRIITYYNTCHKHWVHSL